MTTSIVMTGEERAAFLADVHTGVLSIPDAGRGPLSVPIWYRVDDAGDIVVITPSDSRKAALCEVGGRVSLVAQSEELPPKYVSVEGPIVSIESATPADAEVMAVRYLGEEIGAAYIAQTRSAGEVDEVVITIRPERWFSGDFAKRLG